MLLVISCSSDPLPRNQFINQRFVARPSHPGHLTNQVKNKEGEIDVKPYSLEDPKFRKKMNDFKIACRIGGKRWRVSLDRPGYVRRGDTCLKRTRIRRRCKKWSEEYIPATEHEYLVDAGTYCYKGLL